MVSFFCFCLSLWPMWQETSHLILEQYYFASRMLHMFWHCVWGCKVFSDHIIIIFAMTQTSFLSGHRNILVNKTHCTTWKLQMLLMKKLESQLRKGLNSGACWEIWCIIWCMHLLKWVCCPHYVLLSPQTLIWGAWFTVPLMIRWFHWLLLGLGCHTVKCRYRCLTLSDRSTKSSFKLTVAWSGRRYAHCRHFLFHPTGLTLNRQRSFWHAWRGPSQRLGSRPYSSQHTLKEASFRGVFECWKQRQTVTERGWVEFYICYLLLLSSACCIDHLFFSLFININIVKTIFWKQKVCRAWLCQKDWCFRDLNFLRNAKWHNIDF